jgi:hypothetical protein
VSFPVVFQGWPLSPGEAVAGNPAYWIGNPGAQPNDLVTITGKAPQAPVLGESWHIEALLLNFLIEYEYNALVQIGNEYVPLTTQIAETEKRITALANRRVFMEAQQADLVTKRGYAEEGVAIAKQIVEAEATKPNEKSYLEAQADREAVKVEIQAITAELEAGLGEAAAAKAEKSALERARTELGRQQVAQNLQIPPLTTRVELTGPRDISLLAATEPASRQTLNAGNFTQEADGKGGNLAITKIIDRESFSQRIDLTNPAQALGGDTLTLALTTYFPTEPPAKTAGLYVADFKIAIIDAHLQCSVNNSLART